MSITISDNSNNIFSKFINSASIFKNKNILSSSYIPSKIMHRDQEIEQLTSILAPILKGYKPNNIFIYGTCGTGKTICTNFVVQELNKTISLAKYPKKFKSIFVNAKMKRIADTEYRLFAYILRELGESVPDTGLPTDVLYRRFFAKIDTEKQIFLLILDEIDTLFEKIGDEFLYNITRIGSELKNASISIIGITNNISFKDNLESRVRSSLGEEEIFFKPYNAIQIKDILLDRVKIGFHENTISDNVLNKCAALAAQEHGDARRAIDLLRVAGELAERQNHPKITEHHLDMAEEKLDFDRVIETIKSQPRQSQAVLFSILKLTEKNNEKQANNYCLTGDVYDMYLEIAKKNKLKTLTQRRISDLINELDMLGIISGKVISKGRYGRTREISLSITNNIKSKIENLLLERFVI